MNNVSVPLVRRIYPGADVKYPYLKRFYPQLVEGMTDAEIDARIASNTEDPRKTGLKNGLRQLSTEEIQRVIDYKGEMVLDTYNYEDGKFCPLAVAVGLDKTMVNPTHEKVFNELTTKGYKVYPRRRENPYIVDAGVGTPTPAL